MAWQPPVGWQELSRERRSAYLQRQGIDIPLRTADWDAMSHDQCTTYFAWRDRILYDTPERWAAKVAEYRKELRAWRVLMCWWVLCLLVALAIIWGAGQRGEAVVMRGVGTVFTLIGYSLAIFTPMRLAKPDLPRERQT